MLAIRDMERAGIDIVTDGEIRRESYSNRFATALDGVDVERPAVRRSHRPRTLVPRVVGQIRRRGPVEVRDMQFLRRNTDRATKITLPGPFTMAQQAPTSSTTMRRRWRWTMPPRSTRRLRDLIAGGRGCHPARRALAAGAARARRAVRRAGAQPRARRHHDADDRAPVLRLRRDGPGQEAQRLLVPVRAGGDSTAAADLDRSGAAQSGPRYSRRLSSKRSSSAYRPRDSGSGHGGPSGRAHPQRAHERPTPSGSSPRPIAG